MALSIWNGLSQICLAFWNFLLSLFKKPSQPEEVPPILPITLHRQDNVQLITNDVSYRPNTPPVDVLPVENSGEHSWDDIDASRTDYHSEFSRNNINDGPADWDRQAAFDVYRLDNAVLTGLNTTSIISKYPFSVPQDFSLTGRIPGAYQDPGQSTRDLVVDAQTFALSQLRTQKIREAVTDLKISRSNFDASAFLDDPCSKDSSRTSTKSLEDPSQPIFTDPWSGSPDSSNFRAAPRENPIRDLRAERREIMINFSQLGTYSHSTLSASSTSVFGDFPSPSKVGLSEAECIPLPTGFEPQYEKPDSTPLDRVNESVQRRRCSSVASYPDPFDISMESLEPHDVSDAVPPLLDMATSEIVKHSFATVPAPEATLPRLDLSVPPSETHNATSAVPSHNQGEIVSGVPSSGRATRLAFNPQSARLYSNVKMADTPDRDRYRGAAYSKPVLKLGASSPSLSESSLTFGSPPIAMRPAVYISPTTTPVLASSPVMNAKPRTIRIVHDMTRSPVSLWQDPQRSSATAQENVVPGSKAGNARRRKTQSPQKGSSGGNKPATKGVGAGATTQHTRKSESISKTTGCSVNPSTSSPGAVF